MWRHITLHSKKKPLILTAYISTANYHTRTLLQDKELSVGSVASTSRGAKVLQPYILYSVLRQAHRLFQIKLSTE
jgi:hypothetical protein